MTATEVSKPRLRKRLQRLACIAGLAYVGVIVLLSALENRFVYHPLSQAESWVAPPNERVKDIWLALPSNVTIHGWWCPTPGWRPADGAVLCCHGNGGNLSHRADVVAQFQRFSNQAVLVFDYPGYGRSSGRPSEAGCYAAADRAYDWLTNDCGVAPERLILFGESLGGGVAVDLATRRPHRALVLAKSFTSIADMAQNLYPWLPARWLVRNRFDNLAKIGRCPRPVFIAHGTGDHLVPFAQAERLFAAAPEPKELMPMEGLDHNDPLPPAFYERLNHFLAVHAPFPR